MKTLLYINLDFPPLSGPGIWRALGFIKYLPEHGWRSIVLCSDRSPNRNNRDPSLLAQIPPGTEIHRIRSWFEAEIAQWMEQNADRTKFGLLEWFFRGIHWRFLRDYPDIHLHWASKVAARGIWIAASRKVDCLLTSGPPHIAHAAGLLIRRATGLRWVMDYRDLWTDDPIQVKQKRYQPRLFRRLEQTAHRVANAVVAVSPDYLERVVALGRETPRDRYHLIRNGHDVPDDVVERSLRVPQNERLHVHYNGTVQTGFPAGVILDLLDRLEPDQRPWFTFTGLPPSIRDQAVARGYQRWIEDLGVMGYRESIEYCLRCDVLLVLANPTSTYRGTIPAKVYEGIALGRHLLGIGAPDSDLAPLIEESCNGTMVDGTDVEALRRAVLQIQELHRSGCLNAQQDPVRRRALAEKYSRRHQTRELVKLLDQVTV